MNSLFKSVAWIKVYFNSLASYLGILNFLLLLLTFKNVYNIQISAFVIIPIALLFGGIVAFVDYNFIQKPQNAITNQVNDLKHDLNDIKIMIKEIK